MGYYPSPLSVIAVSSSEGRMDCDDDDPLKVWVVVSGWSYRRAVLTHARPFLEAAGTDDPYALEGRTFHARMDLANPPEFSHEGGERIEFPELELAPPWGKVREEMGLPPEEDRGGRGEVFTPEAASAGLRSWLGRLDEEPTRVRVQTVGGTWYAVEGAEYLDGQVRLLAYPDEVDDSEEDEEDFPATEFVPHHGFSDVAIALMDDDDVDATRSEWPEGHFLRWDSEVAAMMLHTGKGEPEPWAPTQYDVVLFDWIIFDRT